MIIKRPLRFRYSDTRNGLIFFQLKWTSGGSNPVPPVCKTGALPVELLARSDILPKILLTKQIYQRSYNDNCTDELPHRIGSAHSEISFGQVVVTKQARQLVVAFHNINSNRNSHDGDQYFY